MPDLRARILADVRATPSPTRGEHRRRMTWMGGLALAAMLLLFFVLGGVAWGARPTSYVAFTTAACIFVGAGLAWFARPLPGTMLGRPGSALVAAAVVGVGLLAGIPLVAASLWSDLPLETLPPNANVACAALTLLQAAVPIGLLLTLRGRTDPVHPAFTGGVLAVAAAAISAGMAFLRCPHTTMGHLLWAHAAPAVALLALGGALGVAALRVRAK